MLWIYEDWSTYVSWDVRILEEAMIVDVDIVIS